MQLDDNGIQRHTPTQEGMPMAKERELVRISAFIRADQLRRLRDIQDEDGVPIAVQIRRALDAALGTKKKGGK